MPIFSVLGSMEIHAANHVFRPRGAMIQTLFASLLAAEDRFVRADALAEELWGAAPPAKSDNALQAQVSRLRRLLARAEPREREQRLRTNVSGYRFSFHWTELDASLFQHTVGAIRDRSTTDLRRDVADLRDALSLWRGPVFGGLLGGQICQTAAAKYEESKIAALELLFDLELKTDGYSRIIPELTELVRQHPLREQFCSLLMVALYRSGRQIDALDAYRRLRRSLDEDLGVEPSPVLRRYELAILNHDPLLMRPERQVVPDRSGGRSTGVGSRPAGWHMKRSPRDRSLYSSLHLS